MVGVVEKHKKETIDGDFLHRPVSRFRKKKDLGVLGIQPLDTLNLIPQNANPENNVFSAFKSNSTSNIQSKKQKLKNCIASPRSWNLPISERGRLSPGRDHYSFFGNDFEENDSRRNKVRCFSHLIGKRARSLTPTKTRMTRNGFRTCLRPLKKGMTDENTSSICTSEGSIDAPLLLDIQEFEEEDFNDIECNHVLQSQNRNIPKIKNEREDVPKRIKGLVEKRLPSTVEFVDSSETAQIVRSCQNSLDVAATGTAESSCSSQSNISHERIDPSNWSNPYSHLQDYNSLDYKRSESSASTEDYASLSMINLSLSSGKDGPLESSPSHFSQRSSGISTIQDSDFDTTISKYSSTVSTIGDDEFYVSSRNNIASSDLIRSSVGESSDAEHFSLFMKEDWSVSHGKKFTENPLLHLREKEGIHWRDFREKDSSAVLHSIHEGEVMKLLFTPTLEPIDSDIERAFPPASLQCKPKIYAKDKELDAILDNTSLQTQEKVKPTESLQDHITTTHLVQRIIGSKELCNAKTDVIIECLNSLETDKMDTQQCLESHRNAIYTTFENCVENSSSDDESLTTEDMLQMEKLAQMNRSFYSSYDPRNVRPRSIQWWDEDHRIDNCENPLLRLVKTFKQIFSCQDSGVPVGREIIIGEQDKFTLEENVSIREFATNSEITSSAIGDSVGAVI